jgi:predicted dinucleotide-binding enzyme
MSANPYVIFGTGQVGLAVMEELVARGHPATLQPERQGRRLVALLGHPRTGGCDGPAAGG